MAMFFPKGIKVAGCNNINDQNVQINPIALAHPIKAALKTGFVSMSIYSPNGTNKITIGNKSFLQYSSEGGLRLDRLPSDRPFIKSFNYTFQDGCLVDVVVVDSSGGNFRNFYESSIITSECPDLKNPNPKNKKPPVNLIEIDFGWYYVDCDNVIDRFSLQDVKGITFVPATAQGGNKEDDAENPFDRGTNFLKCLVKKIEVENENGFWVYKLTLLNLGLATELNSVAKSDSNKHATGSDDQKVKMLSAFNNALKECNIEIKNTGEAAAGMFKVENQNPQQNNNVGTINIDKKLIQKKFQSSDGNWRGPLGVWNTNDLHKYDYIRTYMNSFVTDEKKGTFFVTDSTTNKPYLLMLEDIRKSKDQKKQLCEMPLATYIVNGGDETPVLSFNPKLEFIPIRSINTAGPSIDRAAGENKDQFNKKSGKFGEGVETKYQVGSDLFNFRAPSIIQGKELEAQRKNATANQIYEIRHPLEVDLVIIGDPSYASTIHVLNEFIFIVYINAYSIGSEGKECEWDNIDTNNGALVGSNINPIFTRKDYMIKGVTHTIDENGNYTTTLRVTSTMVNPIEKNEDPDPNNNGNDEDEEDF
jgi:hypothetical protein